MTMTEAEPRQLAFDLPVREALGREDFFVSGANALAVAALDRWRDWPGARLLLIGPHGAGKSHLARVWAGEAGARVTGARDLAGADLPGLAAWPVVVEDVDAIAGDLAAETALFHLHNLAAEAGTPLLMTGTGRSARWPFALPDLASRVQAAPVATLEAMDDDLLGALLHKLFADRQLVVSPALITWLVRRIDRSFAEAQRIVAVMDARALAARRPITRQLAAEVLDISGPDST